MQAASPQVRSLFLYVTGATPGEAMRRLSRTEYTYLPPYIPTSVCCAMCAVSWASWLLFTGMYAPCVVLRVWCPRSLGSCSPVCMLGVLCCVCRVLSYSAPVHQCVRSASCAVCAVSWATWLLFTGVYARCVVLYVLCPGPLGSCSLVCTPGVLCCVCGLLSHFAPAHSCAHSACCAVCALSWATWLLFTSLYPRCVVL